MLTEYADAAGLTEKRSQHVSLELIKKSCFALTYIPLLALVAGHIILILLPS
jgi:hypothetical protein